MAGTRGGCSLCPMNIVEASAVVKTYDSGDVRVEALRGVDLVLARGEMVSIMGPSGCGKTTLLNCLSGLDSIDGGDVVIDGVSLGAMSDRDRTANMTSAASRRTPVAASVRRALHDP